MKKALSICFTNATALLCVGCQAPQHNRVVRIEASSPPINWSYSVNGHARTTLSYTNLTNQLAQLHLAHGDLILLGHPGAQDTSAMSGFIDWMSQSDASNQAALYYYSASSAGDIFSTPVYHWVAPFNNPRALLQSSFYYEGKALGTGMQGYQNLMTLIVNKHSPQVYILGSSYDPDKGFGANETPYENEDALLSSVLKRSTTRVLMPSPILH